MAAKRQWRESRAVSEIWHKGIAVGIAEKLAHPAQRSPAACEEAWRRAAQNIKLKHMAEEAKERKKTNSEKPFLLPCWRNPESMHIIEAVKA